MSRRRNKLEVVAQELAAGKTAAEASRIAGYDAKASSFVPNAKKRAQRQDVRARVKEMQAGAAERAGLTAEYMLAKLRDYTEFNVDDYLAKDGDGKRFFDIASVSRAKLGRLSELFMRESRRGRGKTPLKILETRIKPHDPIAAMTLGARLQGMLRDKMAFTDPSGEKALPPIAIANLSTEQLEALISRIGVAVGGE